MSLIYLLSWSAWLEVLETRFMHWMPHLVSVSDWYSIVCSGCTSVACQIFWRIYLEWAIFCFCCGPLFFAPWNAFGYKKWIIPPFGCIWLLLLKVRPNPWAIGEQPRLQCCDHGMQCDTMVEVSNFDRNNCVPLYEWSQLFIIGLAQID